MNANEIANGILSALVSITAGCAFVDYWGAIFIGRKLHFFFATSQKLIVVLLLCCCCCFAVFGVVFYHIGCLFEYKLDIKDTARVVPVHGVW